MIDRPHPTPSPWELDDILAEANRQLRSIGSRYVAYAFLRGKRIVLGFPVITKKGKHVMANFELADDEVATIPILVDDAAGNPVPAGAGDSFTAVSSNPASMGVATETPQAVPTAPGP